MEATNTKSEILLSTDSLGGYGLDLVFEVAKETGYDGIDLALWKNFDARNVEYLKKLATKHELPVKVVQISSSINAKEMNQALDICATLGVKVITINAPTFFDLKAYNFIVDNMAEYRKQNPEIKFSIINPEQSNIFALPVPKFRFTNIVEIIKNFSCHLGLDIVNLDETALETEFLRKLSNFVPHISVMYFSDKTKLGEGHVIPGEGVLKLPTILKRFKQNKYNGYISLKLDIDKKDLADTEKVTLILKKCRTYLQENYEEIDIDTNA